MVEITKKEFIEKYGDIKLRFSYYYKYTFHFVSEDIKGLIGYIGGCSDDIYRTSISYNEEIRLEDLEYASDGNVYFVEV